MTSHLAPRESLLVELVEPTGLAVGSATVDAAHRPPGHLHRAFSVLLLDPAGRLLLQRRSAAKTRFPLRWANACCGHPAPGQAVTDAARERLVEEISIREATLIEVGVYLYRASDPVTGRVEHEYDHVLLGRVDADLPLLPDPNEVADLRWMPAEEVPVLVAADPSAYAPWLAGVLTTLAAHSGADRTADL